MSNRKESPVKRDADMNAKEQQLTLTVDERGECLDEHEDELMERLPKAVIPRQRGVTPFIERGSGMVSISLARFWSRLFGMKTSLFSRKIDFQHNSHCVTTLENTVWSQ